MLVLQHSLLSSIMLGFFFPGEVSLWGPWLQMTFSLKLVFHLSIEPNVLYVMGPSFSSTLLWDVDGVLDWLSWHTIQESFCCSECHRNIRRQYQVFHGCIYAAYTQKIKEWKCNCHHYSTLQLRCKLTYPFFEYGSFKDEKSNTIPKAWNSFVAAKAKVFFVIKFLPSLPMRISCH